MSAVNKVGKRILSAVDSPLSGAGLQPGPAHHLLLHLQVKVSRDDGFVAVLHIVLRNDALGIRGMSMTDDLIRQLMASGLSKQQASSATAETLVRLFMKEDGKILIAEAQRQVSEMQALVNRLHAEYNELLQKISSVSDTLLAITESQKEHGKVTDEKAKNVVALYGALLAMNEHAGADATDSVRNAGYVVYAYLGGQAKREITYMAD